jgi:hypothetical protein
MRSALNMLYPFAGAVDLMWEGVLDWFAVNFRTTPGLCWSCGGPRPESQADCDSCFDERMGRPL